MIYSNILDVVDCGEKRNRNVIFWFMVVFPWHGDHDDC